MNPEKILLGHVCAPGESYTATALKNAVAICGFQSPRGLGVGLDKSAAFAPWGEEAVQCRRINSRITFY